jgi:hypothetical protein
MVNDSAVYLNTGYLRDMADNVPEEPAVLTKKQRDYLLGASNIEEKSPRERAVRARIRERVNRSLYDLALLHGTIEGRDIERAFDPVEVMNEIEYDPDTGEATPITEISHQSVYSLATMFDGFSRAVVDDDRVPFVEDMDDEILFDTLEQWIELAITIMYQKQGEGVAEIDTSIDIRFEPTIEELTKRLPDEITIPQYERLLQAGEITQDEFYSFVSMVSGENPVEPEPRYE